MEKPGFGRRLWGAYRTVSLYLVIPAVILFALSLLFYMMDADPERYDRQTEGVITACTDVTDRSRAALENGGPRLEFIIEAEYQVDGVTYTCRESWGSRRTVGSAATVTYNSAEPSDSTLLTDPVEGKQRVGTLVTGSGIALLFCAVRLVPLFIGRMRKSRGRRQSEVNVH